MKRILYHITALLLAVTLCACERLEVCGDGLQEILFDTGSDLEVTTKAMSERTSAAGFTCMATRSDGTTFINNVKTTTSGSYQVVSGRTWPASGSLSFYGVLPNVSMTNNSGTVSCPVGSSSSPLAGTEDYIVASKKSVSNATIPVSMQFAHILSYVEGMQMEGARSDAYYSVSKASFSHPTYGTYNLSSGTWSSTGGSKTREMDDFDDFWGDDSAYQSGGFSLIPGTYTLSVSYEITYNGVSKTYSRSASFTLEPGKKSTIYATLTDDYRSLAVTISVADWVNGTTWSDDCADSSKPVGGSGGDSGSGGSTGPSYTVNLSAGTYGWDYSMASVEENIVYESGNSGVGSSMAVMSITIKGYTAFTFYAYASGESNYDYIAVSKPNTDLYSQITSNGGWKSVTSQSSLSNMHTTVLTPSADPEDPAEDVAYVPVSFSGLSAGTTYTIQVIFGKDGTVNRGLDTGFIYIP